MLGGAPSAYRVPVELIDAALFIAVPLGIIGARAYFVLFNLDFYRSNPGQILNVQGGGLAIHGALIGSAIGLLLVWRHYRKKSARGASALRLSSVLDVLAPALPLGQAIGRFANFVNHEAFGRPTDLPFAIRIPPESRPPEYAASEFFHPAFAYEALWNVIGIALILIVERGFFRRKRAPLGVLFAVYAGWYSLGRFWIEGLRTDALLLGSLRVAQLVSVAMLLVSLAYIWYRYRQWRTKLPAPKSAS